MQKKKVGACLPQSMGTKILKQVENVFLVASDVIDGEGFDFLEVDDPGGEFEEGLVFEEVRDLCEELGSIVPLPKSINQSENLFQRSTEVFQSNSLSIFIGK